MVRALIRPGAGVLGTRVLEYIKCFEILVLVCVEIMVMYTYLSTFLMIL